MKKNGPHDPVTMFGRDVGNIPESSSARVRGGNVQNCPANNLER